MPGVGHATLSGHASGKLPSNTSNADPRPTLDAPDDDPWIWLEEIDGPRSHRLGRSAEREDPGALRRCAVSPRDRDNLAAIYDRPDNIPFDRPARRQAVQLLEGCRQPARAVADDDAGELSERNPNGKSCSTSTRWRKPREKTGSGAAPATFPGSHDRAILSLSRGGGDATVLREFDLTTRSFVAGASICRRQRAAPRGSTATRCCCPVGLWRRHGDPFGLWQDGTAVAARHRSADGPGHLRESPTSPWARGPTSTARPLKRPSGSVERIGLLRCRHWIGDRSGPKTLIDVPTDARSRLPARLARGEAPLPWTIGDKTYRPRHACSSSGWTTSWPASRDFTNLFEPAERRALQGFFMRRGPRDRCRSWTTCARCSRPDASGDGRAAGSWSMSHHRPARSWRRQRLAAGRRGGRESNGDMLANAQDPLTPQSLFLIRSGACAGTAEAGAADLRSDGACRHPARGGVGGRHPHPLYPGRAGRRDRRRAGPSLRLWRLRHLATAVLQLRDRQAVAGARRHQRRRQYPGRRRVRHRLARGRPARGQAAVA